MSSPAIFEPVELRSRVMFRSLARHKFTYKEAIWVCKMVKAIERQGDVPSVDSLCETYQISNLLVKSWIRLYEQRPCERFFAEHFCSTQMELSPIDSVGLTKICETNSSKGSFKQLEGIIRLEVIKSKKRRSDKVSIHK